MDKDFKSEKTSDVKKVPKRLAFIKNRTAARVKSEEEKMVMTFPNLVVKEIINPALHSRSERRSALNAKKIFA
jgi:hypothetical protein